MRRFALTAAALLVALVLAGCAGLPVSGPVTAGRAAGETETGPEVRFLPDGPQPGASPEEIIEGFLRAGSGTSGDWATARLFLAPAIQDVWDPSAGVTVISVGAFIEPDVEDLSATVSLSPRATVDETGRYDPTTGTVTTLAFTLVEVDGEWRISEAPDGIVLDQSVFAAVFHAYSVMYFDTTWEYLVPDIRWYPTTNAAVRIASALIDEPPTAWLQGAVLSAFPEDVTFAWSSVPVSSGTAQVELSPEVLALEPLTLDRMATQLGASLATAGILDVQLTVDGTPLETSTVTTRSTAVAGAPLVLTAAGFGFLSGTELTPIPGLSDVIEQTAARAITVGPDRVRAAVLLEDGTVARATADGAVTTLDTRSGLLAPTIDPLGFVWSMPRGAPAGLGAYGEDAEVPALSSSWVSAGATDVSAIAVSRDGTRMAGVVSVGSLREVWVSGIVRDADGVPTRLGEPILVGVLSGPAASMVWADDATLSIVVSGDSSSLVVSQPVGGAASTTAGPVGAAITSVATAASVRLRAEDGALYLRRGANWLQTDTGIDVLAVQQGSPQ
ncbi:LpqB family beta-propeller domain-containing protein [Microbacterium sediminicola]|uniref:LpqB family beta-propeller domain-containing protein n=1 Tax=Microbacterium sediminicola TaxID=415210 RepID=A0ABP4TLV4_9MICO